MSPGVLADLKTKVTGDDLVLFAGAGVSANLGLPPWSGLIEKMASEIGFDPELFLTLGEFPALAEYYEITKGGRSDLVDWMRAEWHSPSITTLSSRVHDCISRGGFSRIYTTNYDHWLERCHSERGIPCEKIVDLRDLPKLVKTGTRIIKFHGDLDSPDSMVLTESDYSRRMPLDTDLDIQFRSDILQRGVLFIGYSLSDRNLRLILHKLKEMRARVGGAVGAPMSYLFTHRVNHVEEVLLRQWGVEVLVSDELIPSEGLENFLDAIT